jgi:hypothetical protein
MRIVFNKYCRLKPFNSIFYQNRWEYNYWKFLWFGIIWLRKGEWNEQTKRELSEGNT